MYYLAKVLTQFQVPKLKLVGRKFAGFDEELTIWENPRTEEQFALWERDHMSSDAVEQAEIQQLANLKVDKSVPLRTESAEEDNDLHGVYCSNDGLEYRLFRLPKAEHLTLPRPYVGLRAAADYTEILLYYVSNRLEDLDDCRYSDADYIATLWRDTKTGQKYCLWQGWFIECPERERYNIAHLGCHLVLGDAVALKNYAHHTQTTIENYPLNSRFHDKLTDNYFVLFKLVG